MYKNSDFKQIDEETFEIEIPSDRDYKILQLTDMHLGFGLISRKKDRMALEAITDVINKAKPDFIVITGDAIYPFLPTSGTMNNKMQGEKLIRFMDNFKIPYSFVLGNHDNEMGSKLNRSQIGSLFRKGHYSVFAHGPKDIFGVGNYFINLKRDGKIPFSLVHIDSNMYGDGNFFQGFDRIHQDQTDWCMNKLNGLKAENEALTGLAFFHIPPKAFRDAYEKMKLGDKSVIYHHGSVGEKNDHFGICRHKEVFFDAAVENGIIKYMFCGHDHLNTISLTYKGIRLTYGMSIDCQAYSGNIASKFTQRGGTLITLKTDGQVELSLVPHKTVVSKRVRGLEGDVD